MSPNNSEREHHFQYPKVTEIRRVEEPVDYGMREAAESFRTPDIREQDSKNGRAAVSSVVELTQYKAAA